MALKNVMHIFDEVTMNILALIFFSEMGNQFYNS